MEIASQRALVRPMIRSTKEPARFFVAQQDSHLKFRGMTMEIG
jgi:hypothetical protein